MFPPGGGGLSGHMSLSVFSHCEPMVSILNGVRLTQNDGLFFHLSFPCGRPRALTQGLQINVFYAKQSCPKAGKRLCQACIDSLVKEEAASACSDLVAFVKKKLDDTGQFFRSSLTNPQDSLLPRNPLKTHC